MGSGKGKDSVMREEAYHGDGTGFGAKGVEQEGVSCHERGAVGRKGGASEWRWRMIGVQWKCGESFLSGGNGSGGQWKWWRQNRSLAMVDVVVVRVLMAPT